MVGKLEDCTARLTVCVRSRASARLAQQLGTIGGDLADNVGVVIEAVVFDVGGVLEVNPRTG